MIVFPAKFCFAKFYSIRRYVGTIVLCYIHNISRGAKVDVLSTVRLVLLWCSSLSETLIRKVFVKIGQYIVDHDTLSYLVVWIIWYYYFMFRLFLSRSSRTKEYFYEYHYSLLSLSFGGVFQYGYVFPVGILSLFISVVGILLARLLVTDVQYGFGRCSRVLVIILLICHWMLGVVLLEQYYNTK